MCSPLVMARVQAELTRRGLLRAGLAAGAAAAVTTVAGRRSVAAQATPVSQPVATPVAMPSLAGFSAMVDLTHVVSPAFPVYPGTGQMEIESARTIADDGFYSVKLTFNEHTGTHMDAPAHFIADGTTAELIPIDRLVAPLAVIDISSRAASDPDAQLTPDDIMAWEAANGALPSGTFVAMFSGWEARLPDAEAFINADASGVQHYPGIHPDAAMLLVEERDIVGVGVDTLSQDFGASVDFATHVTILGAGKYGVEGIANLGAVPPAGASIIVGGPKHVAASGGPSRLFALY